MKQPIPRSGTEPLKVGDRVQIVPEWQDPGDANFERFVTETPDDCTRVRIQAVVPGLVFQPAEWIEADRLILHPAIPPLKHFTVFCQEAGGGGTIHIDSVEAADLQSAITAGKQQCIDDWSSGTEAGSPWNMETIHCLGVAGGNVEILHWQDQPE